MLRCLYIFTRRGACLFYHEWSRPRNALAGNPEEDQKLMYGLLFSLKQLVKNLSPGEYVVRAAFPGIVAALGVLHG